ncbi:MAG: indole-3-glycerol-phosphate synthase TrpC [Gammaproteobacteria bacterium]|nr:indole-3-glycerol-phosphate synthase TrpC [Gammaproteobacteria bacterium]
MTGFLDEMCKSSAQRWRESARTLPIESLVAQSRALPHPPPLRPDPTGFDIIAEVKKCSPAEGTLSVDDEAALIDRAVAYASAGAAAVSVLTEPTRFDGSLSDLRNIAEALRPLEIPAMRKDFIVDVYQVWEAAAAGAGGVLAIVRVLDDPMIMQMLEAASQCRMFVLLEAFDEQDLRRAWPFANSHSNVIVGLNSRDLTTLEVDSGRLQQLAGEFPTDCLRVAESGIATVDDAVAVRRAGYQFALIGTALMREASPRGLIAHMLASARE